MNTISHEEPTKLIQAAIRPSVNRRLNIAKAKRDLKSISPLVDEILDAALPPEPADYVEGEPEPIVAAEPKRKRA